MYQGELLDSDSTATTTYYYIYQFYPAKCKKQWLKCWFLKASYLTWRAETINWLLDELTDRQYIDSLLNI